MARLLADDDDYEEAMICFARKDLSSKALTAKAEIQMIFNKPEAIKTLERALEKDGDWLPAWVLLGKARLRAGDNKGALDAYDMALGMDEDNVWAWLGKAKVYSKMDKVKNPTKRACKFFCVNG